MSGLGRSFETLSFVSGVLSTWLTNRQLRQAAEQHESGLRYSAELHLQQLSSSLQAHYQAVASSFVEAAQEADRDVWEQRNSQFNTKLLASTLMFGVAMELTIEGQVPDNANDTCLVLLATCQACAIAALGNSILLAFILTRRMAHFMVERAERNARTRRRLLRHAQHLTRRIGEWATSSEANSTQLLAAADGTPTSGPKASPPSDATVEMVARLVQCINRFQDELSQPILSSACAGVGADEDELEPEPEGVQTFTAFWDTHCDHIARWCTQGFYAGGLAVWSAVTLYFALVLDDAHHNWLAAASFLLISSAGGAYAVCVLVREELIDRTEYWHPLQARASRHRRASVGGASRRRGVHAKRAADQPQRRSQGATQHWHKLDETAAPAATRRRPSADDYGDDYDSADDDDEDGGDYDDAADGDA